MNRTGQNHIIGCIYGVFSRVPFKFTATYGVYKRFWPSLPANLAHFFRFKGQQLAYAIVGSHNLSKAGEQLLWATVGISYCGLLCYRIKQ